MLRGQKGGQPASLWEVVNKQRLKESQKKAIEMVMGQAKEAEKPPVAKLQPVKPQSFRPKPEPTKVFREKKPFKGISFGKFAGKLPFKVNPKAAMVIGLAIVAIVLFIFNSGKQEDTVKTDIPIINMVKVDKPLAKKVIQEPAVAVKRDVAPVVSVLPPVKTVKLPDKEKLPAPVKVADDKKKDHIIIITVYQVKRDLEPVKAHFQKNGIETEIVKPAGSKFYYVVSKNKYESPERKGTDGSFALANIKSVGSKYKSPAGYESFGKSPFQDSYGVNVYKSELFKEIF